MPPMHSAIEKFLRWTVIIGVFLLPFIPLIVSTSFFFPYITGKNFAFRFIVEIVGLAWLALALIDARYRPKRNWIYAAFAIFVVVMAAADALGVNPGKSFWSNYERMDGWITIAHLFVYTIVAASVLTTEQLWRRLFQLSLGISVFLDLYGFSQILGVVALGEGGVSGWMARIDATFGNPIYLAAYMLFHVFFAALLIAQAGKERWSTPERVFFPAGIAALILLFAIGASTTWTAALMYLIVLAGIVGVMFYEARYFYGAIIVLDSIALLFTGTRGTTIGLIGGAVLAAVLYAFFTPGAQRARRYIAAALAALVVFGGGLWLARGTAFVHSIGFLDRIASISLTDDTTMARLINWQIAWHGIQERPVLGWGQENYAIVFDKYYDPRMYAQEPWFDRVHNIIFDWWVAGGTLGLLAYLSIFAATLYVLWRSSAFTSAERSILTGLIAGYFCHNFFVFDNVTSYILFGTLLGYIVARASGTSAARDIPLPSVSRGAAPLVALVALVATLFTVWWVNVPAVRENLAIIGGLAQEPGGLSENLADLKLALSYATFGDQEAREQLAQIATQLAGSSVSADTKQQFLNESLAQMDAQAKISPLDARFPLFTGVMLDAYGQYAAAATALQKAHELSPQKQMIIYELALNAQARGDSAGELAYFKQAFDLAQDNVNARIYYATAAIQNKQDALADQILAPIIPTGRAADQRVAAALVARGQYAKLATLWQARVAANPADAQAYLTLAAAYYKAGDVANAVKTLKAAEAVSPSSASQIETLITQIQNGTAQIQ
jgi:cytochrome c-type biogenesis protein CcmH/NrfG